jgi:hypothetical protein
MRNIIIESERVTPMVDDQPYDHHAHYNNRESDVVIFSPCIKDYVVNKFYRQLEDVLVENLRVLKGKLPKSRSR